MLISDVFVFSSNTWNGFFSLFVLSDSLLSKGAITPEGEVTHLAQPRELGSDPEETGLGSLASRPHGVNAKRTKEVSQAST